MQIIKYNKTRRDELANFFISIISNYSDYISHGELQMGIAINDSQLAPNAKELWLEYLDRQSSNPDISIALAIENNEVVGFIIAGIESDGAQPYGMIYDLSVDPTKRKLGIGSQLMSHGIQHIKEMGAEDCYLESGLHNHSAHDFFKRYGFTAVSKIFKTKL